MAAGFISLWPWIKRLGGTTYSEPVALPSRHGQMPLLDDTLFSVVVGNDAQSWRDITDEFGGLVYSTVRPGGTASISGTIPADIWARGYNEVQPDKRIVVRYDGEVAADGIIVPRGLSYQGE